LTYQEQQSEEQTQTSKSTDKLVGTVLDGRFQIEEVLGSGGMSVVYKATQMRVNRHVAIKTLRLQLDSKPVYRERFQREISLLCTLNHPHIVTVYDCVIGADDQPYVVMDYLRGESLEALIARIGAMPVDRFARIAVQVCGALDHAHRKGVIHRDLKPGNIVLMDDDVDLIKVVDFGLAKLNQDNIRLTNSGELWASPPYMSPEQCTGKPEDERSDIYSFGCVMYEMLCGKDPFHYAQTVFELISTHVSVPPKTMTETNPAVEISPAIAAVVMKCLEKDPLNRYQNAIELRDALIHACAGPRGSADLLLLSNQSKSADQTKLESTTSGLSPSISFNMALDPLQGLSPEEAMAQSAAPAAKGVPLAGGATGGAGSLASAAAQKQAAPPTAPATNRAGGIDNVKPAADVRNIRSFEAPPAKSNIGSLIVAAVVGAAAVIGVAFAIPHMFGPHPAGTGGTPNTVLQQGNAGGGSATAGSATVPSESTAAAPVHPATVHQLTAVPKHSMPGHNTTTAAVVTVTQPAAPPPVTAPPRKSPVKTHVAAPPRHALPVKPKRAAKPAHASAGSQSNVWDALQLRRGRQQ